MMDYTLLIEGLRQAKYITPLEKDILDTWDELHKNPFDMNSAARQVSSNKFNHHDIAAMVSGLPTTMQKPCEQITELDLRYILTMQFMALAVKEGWQTNG